MAMRQQYNQFVDDSESNLEEKEEEEDEEDESKYATNRIDPSQILKQMSCCQFFVIYAYFFG